MQKNGSLQQKPSTRAGTRNRSTTSSTTEHTPVQVTEELDLPTQPLLIDREGARLLTVEEQQAYLELRLRGASPSGICRHLGLSYRAVLETLDASLEFQRAFDDVTSLLDQNVEMALYRAAMDGSIPAQSLWLKYRPPLHWAANAVNDALDELEQLPDDKLVEWAKAEGIAIPSEIEAGA